MKITEAEWKLFRKRLAEWQEHYMEGLVREYIDLLNSPGRASTHFWELEKRIRKDINHPGVIMEMRRSTAIWNIAKLVSTKVITLEDLDGFSPELIDAVKKIARV
ncbi:MAG: hypothetical protein J6D53_09155 [Blautia sp.]|nr:hypothetical protein [Blautia sp.]